jgi:hypothetical protein
MAGLVDAGAYCGTIHMASATESSKGTPCISVVFEITDEARDGQWVAVPQRFKRTVDLWLNDNSWPYTKRKLEVLGFNGDFASPSFSKGTDVSLLCSHEVYEGRGREKWELAEMAPREIKPLDQAKVHLFAARWTAETQQQAAPKGKPSPPSRAPVKAAPAPVSEDDLPF